MVGRNQQKSTPIKRKSVWKGKPRATITQTTANNKLALLKSALDKSGFWKHIEQVRRSARVSSDRFRVLIKPDLELFNAGDATGTDPEIVEHLIDLLYDRGYTQVAIGDARNQYTLAYSAKPGGAGGYRQIEVVVRRPGIKVYAKDGYYPLPTPK